MTAPNEAKLTQIFRAVFNRPTLEIRDDLTTRDVAGWDSMNHISLIIMIEQEFSIQFSHVEVTTLKNVGHLKTLIDAKLDRT